MAEFLSQEEIDKLLEVVDDDNSDKEVYHLDIRTKSITPDELKEMIVRIVVDFECRVEVK